MRAKIIVIVTMTMLMCAASARADSVDGKPTHPADRHVPASVRGSPSILFEDVGALGPIESCTHEDGPARTDACAKGRF